jgi:hypothetical protein
MNDGPWRRHPLRSGWTYPIGRNRVQASLLEFGVQLCSLALAMPPLGSTSVQLIRVRRYGDVSHLGKRLQQDERTSMLDPIALRIFATPRDHLPGARGAFDAGALDQALQWVVTARTRGNAWQSTERLWRAHLVEGVLTTSEEQRQSRGPLLGSIGVDED